MQSDPRENEVRQGLLWPCLLVCLAGVLLLGEALVGGKVLSQADSLLSKQPWNELAPEGFQASNPLLDDQAIVMQPWLDFAAERVRAGELPLWNPYNYLGQPIHAANTGAFFWPPHALYYLAPSPHWFVLFALAKIALAGLATLLFLRRLGLGTGAAATGAVSYALGGFLVAWLNHPHANVAPFLPLLLWLVERAATRPGRGAATAIAFATAVQFYGGHVQTSLHVALAVAAWCALRMCVSIDGHKLGMRGLASAAVGALLGAMLAAPQLMPLGEYLGDSQAATLFDSQDVTAEIELGSAASFLVHPDRFGRPDHGDYTGPEGDHLNYSELVGVFVGRIALLLALAQLFLGRRDRRTWIFAGMAALALCVAWQLSPFYEAARALPIVRSTKLARLSMVSSLALAALAALGVQSIAARLAPERRGRLLAATALLAAFELIAWGRGYNPAIDPAQIAPETELTRALASELESEPFRVLGIDNTLLFPNANLFHRIPLVSGYDSIEARRTAELVACMTNDERAQYFIKEIRRFDRLEALPLASMLGIRYLVSAEPLPLPLEPEVFGALLRYRLPAPLPRAFVASSVEVLPTSAERLARLGAPDYDPLVALLDEAPPLALEDGPGAAGTVALERYEPLVVELDAEMQRAGLLVISDAWDPGWRVLVDGVEHPALRVNHALRGVALEAGEHTVEWRYEPRSLRIGLALAGLALLALFLGLVRERRSHKQS